MDVYICPLIQVHIPCMCVCIYSLKLIFVLPGRSQVFTVVAESSFPFFYCMTTRERPGKTKISLGEDVYMHPWLLSHNFCMYIPNTSGRSANTSVVV